MEPFHLDATNLLLIQAIQGGLPLVPRPYAAVAERVGITEEEVMARIDALRRHDVIRRMGVVVRHHELGYRANAMVVWDIPDAQVAEVGGCLARFECITLCYRRPRVLPDWPYNLFTMIHGADEGEVRDRLREVIALCGLGQIPHALLFSRRRFKQRGARYLAAPVAAPTREMR